MKKTEAKTPGQIKLISEASDMLELFGIEVSKMTPRGREKTALCLLTLADMREGKRWSAAKDIRTARMKTRDMSTKTDTLARKDRADHMMTSGGGN